VAVLIEGLSVVIRYPSIAAAHQGGARAFALEVPNRSWCEDGELARVGFMTPEDVRAYVEHLESRGLKYLNNRTPVDIVVVDQRTGPVVQCDWMEFGIIPWDRDAARPVAVCRAKPSRVERIVAPQGWVFENSLSARHRFVPQGKLPDSLKLVRHEPGLVVYRDEQTGEEFYVGRSGPGGAKGPDT
jgi:hypothetical protein